MTIFIAGIHGVGKTYLAKPAAERLSLVYATASQLIREERGSITWDKNKQVDEVAENQAALLRAVKRINDNGNTLMLDGHLVLRKSINQHERLPEAVFRDLSCEAIILLTCSTEVVKKRLTERGDSSWSTQELEEFAKAEAEHSETVAGALEIPLICLSEPSIQDLIQALSGLRPSALTPHAA
ncbi:hypothetical protein GCM10022279_11840 [Comamonas faecalis]|uniref:AAA family ATPase n=1 Tax=Comamonas faecalis TaxID=1387849 RepID=A0ABP7QZE9_9BURK|nr:ATP-binding protein [Oryzisolibacter propanilivorax]